MTYLVLSDLPPKQSEQPKVSLSHGLLAPFRDYFGLTLFRLSLCRTLHSFQNGNLRLKRVQVNWAENAVSYYEPGFLNLPRARLQWRFCTWWTCGRLHGALKWTLNLLYVDEANVYMVAAKVSLCISRSNVLEPHPQRRLRSQVLRLLFRFFATTKSDAEGVSFTYRSSKWTQERVANFSKYLWRAANLRFERKCCPEERWDTVGTCRACRFSFFKETMSRKAGLQTVRIYRSINAKIKT